MGIFASAPSIAHELHSSHRTDGRICEHSNGTSEHGIQLNGTASVLWPDAELLQTESGFLLNLAGAQEL